MPGPSATPAVERLLREGVLITAELDVRPRRWPDYAAENAALHALAQALTTSHTAMLQTLVDTARSLCSAGSAGSAGISLREPGAAGKDVFRWVAVSGDCAHLKDHVIPGGDSPAGVAIALDAPQLIAFPTRQFACLSEVVPDVMEELVVPVPGSPEPWGALWVMSHDREQRFDSEHRRILASLANFTCAALTIAKARADTEARVEDAEAAKMALAIAEANKDNFIATVGHELRGPLGPIDTALEAAQKLAAGSPAVLSALALAGRQVQQLKRLVNDLLDISRVRQGKLAVNLSHCLLGDIVKDALAAVGEDAKRRGHQLHAVLPPYPVTVLADAARLTQVLSNLLSNAVKYTSPGGEISLLIAAPDPSLIPEDDVTKRDVVITLRDSGMGIAPELLPRVFDLYSQSPSLQGRAEGGLGLGLSVVKYLVDAHDGEVDIASDGDGKGTEVTLRLPIVCRSGIVHSAPTTHGIAPSRILLVDDNADATEALAMLLTLDGHEVRRALSGPEALAIVRSFAPDVALIDISMPGMDGFALAGRLRQNPRCAKTRLVALTGYSDTAETAETFAGFDEHLIKPPSLEDLSAILVRQV